MVVHRHMLASGEQAVTHAETADFAEVLGTLETVLGREIAALAAQVSGWDAVVQLEPTSSAARRLRRAYAVVTLIRDESMASNDHEPPETIMRWFMGMNPALGGNAPVTLLDNQHFGDLMNAALYFVDGDYS